MLIRTLIAVTAIVAAALSSGCSHTQWRQFHGCKMDGCGTCSNALRKAHCGLPDCHDCGTHQPVLRGKHSTGGGKHYDSCDGCGDGYSLGVQVEYGAADPDCGIAVEPGCGVAAGKGCRRHGIGCWRPGALLREIFSCDGCTGPTYWSEWYNDPPDGCEPCDHYGNYTGPQYGCSVYGGPHHGVLREVPTPVYADPYYDGKTKSKGEVEPAPSGPPPAPPRETRLKSRVVPTSYVTPLNTKCNCK